MLACLDRDPRIRLEAIAAEVELSVRTVQRLLDKLDDGGLISRRREGSHYLYDVRREARLRAGGDSRAGDLLRLLER